MAIVHYPPNTIYLGGRRIQTNDLAASEAIKPGMLVERFNSGTTHRWRKHTTAAGPCHTVATNQSMMNLGVDALYAANDLVEVSEGGPGSTWWMLIASGANIAFGDKLESAGDGRLRAFTASPTPFIALETVNNTAGPGDARIRVEVV